MYRISYTNKGTIPSGIPYSNISPCYTLTRELEEGDYDEEFNEIKSYIDDRVKRDFDTLVNFTKKNGYEGRVTTIKGVDYAHVTNIITPETPPILNIEDHATLGTYLDLLAKETYFQEGNEIIIPTGLSIKQNADDIDDAWDSWFAEFGGLFKPLKKDIKVKNDRHLFVGEADFLAEYDGKLCMCDFKKTKTLTKELRKKYFMQMSAYSKNCGEEIQGMVIMSPFNKPIFDDDIDGHYEDFLVLRGIFKEKYGI